MECDGNMKPYVNAPRFAILNQVLSYKKDFLWTRFRVFICLLVAAPLAPLVAFSVTFIFTSTLICLPFLVVPLSVILFTTLVAYLVWRLMLKSLLLTAKKRLDEHAKQPWQNPFNFLPDSINFSPQFTGNQQPKEPRVDNFVSCDNFEDKHEDGIRKLNVRSILHISRPRFYSVREAPPWENVETAVPDSNLSGYPKEVHTTGERCNNITSYPRTESTILLKNIAIVKNYPNDTPTMLEKLEEMHRLLTNIRRRVNHRRPAHVHLRQHR